MSEYPWRNRKWLIVDHGIATPFYIKTVEPKGKVQRYVFQTIDLVLAKYIVKLNNAKVSKKK